MLRIARAAECRVMPWKNGGGTTTEIAVCPPGAGLGDFLWRVSMARVESDGPFSIFPGVDRTLTILEGEGIRLAVDGREPVRLTPESEPFAFPADVPAGAALIGGPVTDLNVMTRRGGLAHHVSRVVGQTDIASAGTTLVFCQSGGCVVSAASRMDDLEAGDTAILENAAFRVTPAMGAPIYLIEITPAG